MRGWWFWNVRYRLYWHIAQFDRRVHGRGPLLVAMGDSHTEVNGYTLPWQIWLRRVGRLGYRTVNLGRSGDTTADLCQRIEQFLIEGQPEFAVVFAGTNDAKVGLAPEDTARNITSIITWLRERAVHNIALIGPGVVNVKQPPDWLPGLDRVRAVLRDIASQHDVVFVDLGQFLRDRIARGEDPDFARVPYRQSRSWHPVPGNGHFNAYGQRLIAAAFLAATPQWRLGRRSEAIGVAR